MTKNEILENLCEYDERNPNFEVLEEWEEGETAKIPRVGCFCDNCFYQRDKLALELLNYRTLLKQAVDENDAYEAGERVYDLWLGAAKEVLEDEK